MKGTISSTQPLLDVTEDKEKKSRAEALMRPVDVSQIKIPPTMQDQRFDQLIYREPFITKHGNTYEFERISEWLEKNNTDPADNEKLESKELIPNKGEMSRINLFLDKNPQVRDSAELYLPRRWIKELKEACESANLETIKRLYELDRRLFSWTFDFTEEKYAAYRSKNILHISCVKGKPTAILKLIEYMEKRAEGLALLMLLQEDQQGNLPIHYAMKPESDPQLRCVLALSMGKHLAQVASVPLPTSEDKKPRHITALHLAAMTNQTDIIELILQNKENKIDITTKDHQGNTALHLAVNYGSIEAIRSLIKYGASADIENDTAQTPEALGLYSDQGNAVAVLQEAVSQRAKTQKAQLQSSGPIGLMCLQQQQLIEQMQLVIQKQSLQIDELQEQIHHLSDELTRQRVVLHPVQRNVGLIEQERPTMSSKYWQPTQFIGQNLPVTPGELRELVLKSLPGRTTQATLFFSDAKPYLTQNKICRALDVHAHIRHLTTFQDGTLATVDEKTIKIWRGQDCVLNVSSDRANPIVLMFLPNRHLACAYSDGFIYIWDINQGSVVAKMSGNKYPRALAVLPGDLLASGTREGHIDIWNTKTFKCLGTLQLGYNQEVGALAVLPNGHLISRSIDSSKFVESGATFASIKIWDLRKQSCLQTVVENEVGCYDSYTSLAILPNNRLASGSGAVIKIWDIDKKTCISELKGHFGAGNTGSIQQLDVLPDGSLVSASKWEIRIWRNGICIAAIYESQDTYVWPFTTMPDGSGILSAVKNQVKIWFIGKPLTLDLHFQEKLLLAHAQLYLDSTSKMMRIHTAIPCQDGLQALAKALQTLSLECALTIKISETELFISDIKDQTLFLDLEKLCQLFGVSKLPSSVIQTTDKKAHPVEEKKHKMTGESVPSLTSTISFMGDSRKNKKDYFNKENDISAQPEQLGS